VPSCGEPIEGDIPGGSVGFANEDCSWDEASGLRSWLMDVRRWESFKPFIEAFEPGGNTKLLEGTCRSKHRTKKGLVCAEFELVCCVLLVRLMT
jgi:hypothetical protein